MERVEYYTYRVNKTLQLECCLRVTEGSPAVWRNGQIEYPAEPTTAELSKVWAGGVEITDVISEDVVEEILTKFESEVNHEFE